MSDIVKRLRGFDTLKLDAWAICDDAADLIERQRAALRVAREALQFYANAEVYKSHPHGMAFDDRDVSYKAKSCLAAIDAALKETRE